MNIKYRPELDVIKLLSIGLVLFYSANIKYSEHYLFQGGFIGVDFFFVISGYLITSLILKELSVSGTFSFKNFYERRARRILPALILVMLVSIPFAWKYLLPSSLVDYAKSLLYSLGFISNIYYVNNNINLFANTSAISTLVHFYLLFPILFVFLYKYIKKKIVQILFIFLLLSLFYLLLNFNNNHFNLFSKFWLFLLGSIIFYRQNFFLSLKKGILRNNFLSFIFLFLIFIFAVFYNSKFQYNEILYLISIFIFCYLIIYLNDNKILYKFLTINFLAKSYFLAYPIYLLHFPIFNFSKIINYTQGNIINKFILILIILFLAIIISFLTRNSFLNKKSKLYNLVWFFIIPLTLLIIIFCFITINKSGFEKRFPQVVYDNFNNEPIYNQLKQSNKLCFNRIFNFCNFNKSSNKKIILIGDSHMGSLMYSLKDTLIEKNYNFIPITKAGFTFLPGTITINNKTKKKNLDYEIINKNIQSILKNTNNQIVIIGGMLSLYIYEKRFIKDNKVSRGEFGSIYLQNEQAQHDAKFLENEFEKMIKDILKKNKVILVYPIPNSDMDINKNLLKINDLKKKLKKNQYLLTSNYQNFLKINSEVFTLLDNLDNKNLFRVFPHKIFCNNQVKRRCILHDAKYSYFENSWHPSKTGAKLINNLILRQIEIVEELNNIQ